MSPDSYTLRIKKETLTELREILLNAEPVEEEDTKAHEDPNHQPRAWESEPATERQIAFLNKAKINYRPGITKGDASRLIDHILKTQGNWE